MASPAQLKSPPPAPKPAVSRMTLSSVVKGKQTRPLRITLYGVEGIGKSTFAAGAPAPIFLGAEDGTAHLDVTRFPMPQSWEEVLDAVRVLERDAHAYKTLVVDTLDWAEPLVWKYVCDQKSETSIEDFGYGKGYSAALDQWRVFLAALERLRERKGMHIIFLAHSWIKTFKDPEQDDYDRYELKLNNKAGGLIKEWSDIVLFANFETLAHKDKATKRVRGISSGARFIYTNRKPAYDAKNRHDLPDRLPLNWADFFAAIQAGRPADPKVLAEEIREKAKQLGAEKEAQALEFLEKNATNAAALAQLNDRINAVIATEEGE